MTVAISGIRIYNKKPRSKFDIGFSYTILLSGCGGIGRRARFRFWWETVQVQVLSAALKRRTNC